MGASPANRGDTRLALCSPQVALVTGKRQDRNILA
jgi:hypothetical protein